MGSGIAHVSAFSGFNTILVDVKDEFVKRGFNTIQKNLKRQVNKKKISQTDMDISLARIDVATDFEKISTCDLVIEAAIENEEVKLKIFKELDSICQSNVILASNTSSISITKIASVTNRPKQVIGMHFMNPVPIMKLVEIVQGKETNASTTNLAVDISKIMGKIPLFFL